MPRPWGVFHPRQVAVVFFSKSVFGRGRKLPKLRGSIEKKSGAPLSQHASRVRRFWQGRTGLPQPKRKKVQTTADGHPFFFSDATQLRTSRYHAHPRNACGRREHHTQLVKMSSYEILDLTGVVYFSFLLDGKSGTQRGAPTFFELFADVALLNACLTQTQNIVTRKKPTTTATR